jgi:hypothetical protein
VNADFKKIERRWVPTVLMENAQACGGGSVGLALGYQLRYSTTGK